MLLFLGGALHLHEFAITSVDWVVANITYRDNLYSCYRDKTESLVFGWFEALPEEPVADCDAWVSTASERESLGNERYD
jgi:adenosine deaminase CECR1